MNQNELLDYIAKKIIVLKSYRPVLIGIDGVDGAGKSYFATRLLRHLEELTDRLILLSSTDCFHNPRHLRYNENKLLHESYYEDSFNYTAIKEKLLDPLRLSCKRDVYLRLFDHKSDSYIEPSAKAFDESTILLFEGIFNHRPELCDYWDLSIFLDCNFNETFRRMNKRDGCNINPEDATNERYYKGQLLYLEKVNPKEKATIVINNSNYKNPVLISEK
jgi:uridine kinase